MCYEVGGFRSQQANINSPWHREFYHFENGPPPYGDNRWYSLMFGYFVCFGYSARSRNTSDLSDHCIPPQCDHSQRGSLRDRVGQDAYIPYNSLQILDYPASSFDTLLTLKRDIVLLVSSRQYRRLSWMGILSMAAKSACRDDIWLSGVTQG